MQHEASKPYRPHLFCAQGKVYATSQREIFLLERGQKQMIYQHTPPGRLAHAALTNDACYISFQEPGQQQEMLAVSLQNGALLWRTLLEGYLPDVPYVYGDHIYLCSSWSVTVLRREDGSLAWRRRLQAGWCEHPVIWNKTLYVTIQEHLSRESRRKHHRREQPALVALRCEDGAELWRTSLPDNPQFFGAIIPVHDLLCLSLSHGCVAIHAQTGTILWQWIDKDGPYHHGFFTVENRVCYLGGRLTTWPMRYESPLPSDLESFQNLPFGERARLNLLIAGQQSHHLATVRALRLPDGVCLWQQIFEYDRECLLEGIVSGKRVFLLFLSWLRGTRSTDLLAVLSENGLPLWQKHVCDYLCGAPLIVDDVLYFGADDGHVYALRTDTGDLLWSIPITLS
jgi:outer membrane protein assembly factor BamB